MTIMRAGGELEDSFKSSDPVKMHLLTVVKNRFGCAHSEEETPVPIPNTEVKLPSGDGTALLSVGE